MLIGYARVSKTDGSQSLDLQRDALRAEGIDAVNLYHDFASGVRDDRPGLDTCLRALRKGDVLVAWKLDRLGRNLAHLVNTVQDLSARGVGLRVLTGQGAQIDTTTAAGRLVFGIFAALAEFERELIRERTVAGLKAARARGRKGGQEVRAVESPGAAGSGRDGPPRHVGVRTVPPTRHQAGDALQVRRTAGPEGPRLLNRSAWIATPGGRRLSVGFRPLPQTTRSMVPSMVTCQHPPTSCSARPFVWPPAQAARSKSRKALPTYPGSTRPRQARHRSLLRCSCFL